MTGPDLRGCAEHGLDDFRVYTYADGRTEKRCLVCQRNRTARHHNWGPRCRRGHLKTPWTWRKYSGIWRCMACQKVRRLEKRALSQASTQTEEAA